MSHLIPTLKNAIAGAEVQALTDPEIRAVIMSIINDDKREMDTAAAADELDKSCSTLKRWRRLGIGPTYRKDAGGAIRYRLDWLREFQEDGTVHG